MSILILAGAAILAGILIGLALIAWLARPLPLNESDVAARLKPRGGNVTRMR